METAEVTNYRGLAVNNSSQVTDTAPASDTAGAPPALTQQKHPVTGEPTNARYDLEMVHTLAKVGCTVAEIARLVKCNYDDLRGEPYRETIEHGRANMNLDLRRKQLAVAMAGDSAMLKWMGQIYLKQTAVDKQVVKMDFSRMTDADLDDFLKATNGEDYRQQSLFD